MQLLRRSHTGDHPLLTLRLTRDLQRSILRGQPWIFADNLRDLPSSPPGTPALLLNHLGHHEIARGFYDPSCQIAFRVCHVDPGIPLDDTWAERKLKQAVALREIVLGRNLNNNNNSNKVSTNRTTAGLDADYDTVTSSNNANKTLIGQNDGVILTNGYRMLNGEGDGLPGLVCDVYNETAVLSLDGNGPAGFWNTQGLAKWLQSEIGVQCVVERNRIQSDHQNHNHYDHHHQHNQGHDRTRDHPHIPPPGRQCRVRLGYLPKNPVSFLENGVRFFVDVVSGQKTGFFLDQREHRQLIRRLSANKTVLNVFGYSGGFSVNAGLGGATHVTTVDISQAALDMAQLNWQHNHLPPHRHTVVTADAFHYLSQIQAQKQRRDHQKNTGMTQHIHLNQSQGPGFDIVIIDPPSMAPSKKSLSKALQAYKRLIQAGAAVTNPNGLLAVSSCSSHVDMQAFLHLCQQALAHAKRNPTILSISGQPSDHPTPLAFPEFRYLKFVLIRVS